MYWVVVGDTRAYRLACRKTFAIGRRKAAVECIDEVMGLIEFGSYAAAATVGPVRQTAFFALSLFHALGYFFDEAPQRSAEPVCLCDIVEVDHG